ncbi:MAG: hypothetical protein DRR19_31875 [Candidatus Parabeggiatoa sp. nov. 1]|nr:MAG: hypothetical protein DRR19_31875 [Gammaproteobacteria bacterium]
MIFVAHLKLRWWATKTRGGLRFDLCITMRGFAWGYLHSIFFGLRFLKVNSLNKTWFHPYGVEFEFEAQVFLANFCLKRCQPGVLQEAPLLIN